MLRVGVDIGGTFTDIAIEDGARRWSAKVPTTHGAPEDGVMVGLARGLALAGASLGDVGVLIHGTTLATNALLERNGACTALLTTVGFRDVLEMGNEGRCDQYDLRMVKPEPLVPRRRRWTVAERIRHDGSVAVALDEAGIRAAALEMGEAGVEAVAIMFLHAYADGAHERRAAEILTETLGDVPISLSHEVSPEMREYDRASTTVANAYLQPVVSAYLLRLEQRLRSDGLSGPMLMILSSGSLATVETASRFPIRLLESGPAGGAIFASDIARRLGREAVLSFDVGGTTAKFCMIDDGEAHHALAFEVGRTYRFKKGSGLPVRVPVVDLVEIGAGGGSIARIDAVGRIVVGPESAGSEPGPACYGKGGTAPTITDCDLVLGKLDAPGFAGGTMQLDAEAANRAVGEAIGGPTGLALENAAFAVTETLTESMAAAARVHAAEVGTEIEDRLLIAFGGGAPLHAARFAEKLGIREIIVPAGAGVGSAIGFLRAPIAYDVVRSLRFDLPGGDLVPVRTTLAEMEAAAREVVARVDPTVPLAVKRTAYVRYAGQGHELATPVEREPEAADFAEALRAAFDATYRRLHGRSLDDSPGEVTGWSIRVEQARSAIPEPISVAPACPAIAEGERRLFNGALADWEGWPVYRRSALSPGAGAEGPAVIVEDETTTIVPPSFRFAVDSAGFLHLTRIAP
jgi:N-methylhydantoinase A